jgi:hypothetical protein
MKLILTLLTAFALLAPATALRAATTPACAARKAVTSREAVACRVCCGGLPGGLHGGRDIGALTTHMDLMPTLIVLCGLNRPEAAAFDGVSLAPLLRGETQTAPERSMRVQITKTKGRPGNAANVAGGRKFRPVAWSLLSLRQAPLKTAAPPENRTESTGTRNLFNPPT